MFAAYAHRGARWGLWRSRDGLKTFEFVSEPMGQQILWTNGPLRTCAACVAPNGDFLYVWDTQLWRSKDSGKTWSVGYESGDTRPFGFDSLVSLGSVIFALVEIDEGKTAVIVISKDNGTTWERYTPAGKDLKLEPDFLLADQKGRRLICVGRKAIHVTTDGRRWTLVEGCWRNGMKRHTQSGLCRENCEADILESGEVLIRLSLGEGSKISQKVILSATPI
jgi:hypothetical protein